MNLELKMSVPKTDLGQILSTKANLSKRSDSKFTENKSNNTFTTLVLMKFHFL